jgi:hypothetical protein
LSSRFPLAIWVMMVGITARRLAGSVCVERPDHFDRRTESCVEGQGNLVGAYLARRVGRLPLERMILRDGDETSRSIDLAGGRVDHLRHTQFAPRLHDVERAFYVGINVGIRRVIRIGDRNQRSKMQHCIAALHCCAHAVRITDVTREHLELADDIECTMIKPAPAVEGVI